jgi:alginate biosynthesis protein AlgX
MFFARLLFLSLIGFIWLSSVAWAEGPYQCPDLSDKEKLTFDEMTQGKDGWFFRITRDLNSQLLLTPEAEKLFSRLAFALQRRGTLLVLSPVPPRATVARDYLDMKNPVQAAFSPDKATENYQHVTRSLAQAGVMMPDLFETTPPPREMSAERPFFFKRDHHWTPYGARAVAQKIGELVKATELYKTLKPSNYETKIISRSGWKPAMAIELQRLCRDVIPPEPFERFQTQMVAGNDADALFGDEDASEPAVLVGSSFSAVQEYNFDGFLMEATGLEIANHAISAGMQFNAITSYTSSPGFETARPPFIIWEMPHLIDIGEQALVMFRQIIPATYGACTEDAAIAKNKVNIKGGKAISLLKIAKGTEIQGQNYYLFLVTPNLGLSKFTLQFEYDDGDGEWFTVDRSQHFENTGRFFVELSDETEGNLDSVIIDGLPNINAEMEVRLCSVPGQQSN